MIKHKLFVHLRTHYNMKPYICHICSKSFNNRGNLNIHMRIHTGKRPYLCKICGKAFKTEGHVRHHLFSHSKHKNFQCPYYSKFYKRKGVLKEHMLIHMDDPSFIKNKEYYDKIVEILDNKNFSYLFNSYINRNNSGKISTNNSTKNDSHIDWGIGQQIKSNDISDEILPNVNNIKMNSFISVKNYDLKTENVNIIDDDNVKSSNVNNSLIKEPGNNLLLGSRNIADIFQIDYGMESIDEKNKISLSEINDENTNINNYLILEDIMN